MSVKITQTRIPFGFVLFILSILLFSACNSSAPIAATTPVAATGVAAATSSASADAPGTPTPPDWFNVKMTDVQTGQAFSINDFAGKVVLIETMAQWCPTCRHQEEQVKKLHDLLGNRADFVSVSLDVDLHEDTASLQKYANAFGFDWHYAIAPLEVQRALGNLYNAQYLNPPLAPMLLIDRKGQVYGLPYGLKSAEQLQKTIEPHLAQ